MSLHSMTWMLAGCSIIAAATASAQIPGSMPAEEAPELVVTGSRIASSVAAELGATPIRVLDDAAIDLSGTQTVPELLATDPSFLGAASAIDGDSSGKATLNLRGLGAQYTLTLVNGRRVSVNEPGNVLAIPSGAIERVEILRSGASAVYGSDAVSGVVNLVLKTDAEGGRFDAYFGDVTDGSAAVRQGSLSFGASNETTRLFAIGNYYKRGTLNASERRVTQSNDQRALGGRDFRSSFGNPATIGDAPGTTGPIILDTTVVGPGQTPTSPDDFRPYVFEQDGHDRPFRTALSGTERLNFYASVEHDIVGDSLSLFAEGLYSEEDTFGRGGTTTISFQDPAYGPIPATNPYNPFGTELSDVRFRPLELGPALGLTDVRTARLVGGVRGKVGQFDYEVAATYLRSEVVDKGPTAISRAGLREAIRRTGPDAFNPFGNLANSPEQYRGVAVTTIYEYKNVLNMYDAKLSGPIFALPGGDVMIAVGAEYRKERARQTADALSISGDIVDQNPFVPSSLRRTVKAAFAEIRVPLLPGSGRTSPLELTGAIRHEHYSDFGGTWDPLVTLRWEAVPDVLTLRTSYSTSFRAPYLEQLAPNTRNLEVVVSDPLLGGAQVEAQAIAGGNPDLGPENASTFSVGTIFQPRFADGLSVTIDYFRLRQSNVIIAPSAQLVLLGLAPGNVLRGDGIGTGGEDLVIEAIFQNIAGRRVDGIDFATRYVTGSRESGLISLDLAATRILNFKVDASDGRGFINYAGEYTSLSLGSGFGGIPKWKGLVSATWNKQRWTLHGVLNYIGKYLDERAQAVDPNNPRSIRAHATVDAQVRYDLGGTPEDPRASLTVGVENMFDRKPPFLRATNSYDSGLHDLRGRFIYASVSTRF